MPSRPRPSRARRSLLIAVPLVAVAAAGGFWLTDRAGNDGSGPGSEASAATTTQAPGPGDGDLAVLPPERTGGAPVTTEPPSTIATDPPAPTEEPRGDVTPQLTYFGWNADLGAVEAGGIVPSVVESGGVCTLTLTQGQASADVSSEAVDNVTSTSCSEMVVPGERLTPGPWRAVLTYASDTTRGASEPVEIEVP